MPLSTSTPPQPQPYSGHCGFDARAALGVRLRPAAAAALAAMDGQSVSQTPLWITLGVLYGAAYSLSADHYTRAQTNSHIFVRASMLGLSCGVFLASTAGVGYVLYWIRRQDLGLDGLERVYSVLIPVVVRGDLLIDWGKRVVWLLFLARSWTQSCVALRRILRRADEFERLAVLDGSVAAIARGEGRTLTDFTGDLLLAESDVWADGAESLFRMAQIGDHVRKLSKVAMYAAVGFVGAVPGAMAWVGYATYKGFMRWGEGYKRLAIAYWFSVLLAPVSAVVCLFVSAFAFLGIIGLSVMGACAGFGVHWSTRMVYTMLRMALSQAWADFPFVMRKGGAVASFKEKAEKLERHVIELPGVIGKQVVEIPTRVKREVMELPAHFNQTTDRSRASRRAEHDAKESDVPRPVYRVYPAFDNSPPVEQGEGVVDAKTPVAIVGPAMEAAEEGRASPRTGSPRPGLGQVDGLFRYTDIDTGRRGSDTATAPASRSPRRKRARPRTSSFPVMGGVGHGASGVPSGAPTDPPGGDSDKEDSDGSSTDDDQCIGLYHGMVLERHPDEAGVAMARLGFLLPTELEFALATWDGLAVRRGEISVFRTAMANRSADSIVSEAISDATDENANVAASSSPYEQPSLEQASSKTRGLRSRERRELRYMSRLGMDGQMDSAPKRRLTVFYCLGMIAQLQVSSGGNSWQLRKNLLRIPATTKLKEFISAIARMDSIVACEAAEACIELGDRLHNTPKYRTIPAAGHNVEVGVWLRALLLVLLADPLKPPAWMPVCDDYDSAFPGSLADEMDSPDPKPIARESGVRFDLNGSDEDESSERPAVVLEQPKADVKLFKSTATSPFTSKESVESDLLP